eukprot:SAG31_NODE_2099_length_6447_cov_8.302615_7_plen_191_part_00
MGPKDSSPTARAAATGARLSAGAISAAARANAAADSFSAALQALGPPAATSASAQRLDSSATATSARTTTSRQVVDAAIAANGGAAHRGKGCYFLVFVPTLREIRDFYREMQRTNRESVNRVGKATDSEPGPNIRRLLTAAGRSSAAAPRRAAPGVRRCSELPLRFSFSFLSLIPGGKYLPPRIFFSCNI